MQEKDLDFRGKDGWKGPGGSSEALIGSLRVKERRGEKMDLQGSELEGEDCGKWQRGVYIQAQHLLHTGQMSRHLSNQCAREDLAPRS